MRTNPTMLAGVIAPLVYAFTVILGGWLTPGYSHAAQPISALIMPASPAAPYAGPLFTFYNALLIVFAFGLRGGFRKVGASIWLLVPLLLSLTGLAGILMGFYAMDPIGATLTYGGKIHIWLAGLASVASMLTLLLVALKLRRDPAWWRFAGYSFISLIVIFFSGALAALAAARTSPVMGLWERITIGAYLQWLFVLAVVLVLSGRTVTRGR